MWGWNQSRAKTTVAVAAHTLLFPPQIRGLFWFCLSKMNSEALTAVGIKQEDIYTVECLECYQSSPDVGSFSSFPCSSWRLRIMVSPCAFFSPGWARSSHSLLGSCSPSHPSAWLAPGLIDLTVVRLRWLRQEDNSTTDNRNKSKHSANVSYEQGPVLSTLHVLIHVAF